MKLKTVKIKGVSVDISVDSKGEFSANPQGQYITDSTMEGLEKKIGKAISARNKIKIPFFMYEDYHGTIRSGVVVGIHGGNGNSIVKFDDEESSKQLRYSGYNVFIYPEFIEEFKAVLEDKKVALEKYKKVLEKAAFDVYSKAEEEMQKLANKDSEVMEVE